MTIGMQQHQVLAPVFPAIAPPDKMVGMPLCQFGDLLVADWTETLLLLPQEQQASSPPQGLLHLDITTTLEVAFPRRVERIRICTDLNVSFDWRLSCSSQPQAFDLAIWL